jgi:hypothetical protein
VLAYDDDAASKRKALVKNFMASCSDDIIVIGSSSTCEHQVYFMPMTLLNVKEEVACSPRSKTQTLHSSVGVAQFSYFLTFFSP